MRATGVIRRIDDLGRVVIPKEIRKAMNISDGDPLEIYTKGDCVYLRRYRVGLTEDVNLLRKQVEEYARDFGYHYEEEIKQLFDELNDLLRMMEEDE